MNIAVVIPCRNEVLYIEDTIHAIYNSNLPDNINIEVFVVDGMSDDGTREKVHLLSNSYSNLNLVDNKNRLTPFAFNIGIKAAGLTDFIQIVGARHILYLIVLTNFKVINLFGVLVEELKIST